MKKANTSPKVDKNLPSCAFTKGAGKSGGQRDTFLSGGEKGSAHEEMLALEQLNKLNSYAYFRIIRST
jgi:hypothetical protein